MKRKKLADLSYHQGDIDFSKLVGSVDGVILREGYRRTIDKKFAEYCKGCAAYNIPIYAIYHFIYALSTDDAIAEAMECITNMLSAGHFAARTEIIIFADYEYDTIKNAQKYGITLTKHDCNQITEAFCAAITNLGYKAGVYMNLDFYKNYYIDAIKNKYPIWLADYTGDADYPCLIHQYTNQGSLPGIKGDVDLNYYFESSEKDDTDSSKRDRAMVVELAEEWLGKNEKDGSFKEIIDIYNSFSGLLPRGLKMQYNWSWCACTWSAIAIKLGYTDIMPIEISCGNLVEKAREMGIWQENDKYIPMPGDAILYDWQDNSTGDNVGWPDHIGIIVSVDRSAGYFITIEGNYDDTVKKRTVSINGKFIRGFITPKYNADSSPIFPLITGGLRPDEVAHEVISGLWGNSAQRKDLLEKFGYNYSEIQTLVNKILNGTLIVPENPSTDILQPYDKIISATTKPREWNPELFGTYKTTAALYMRNDAGKNKKALCIIPKGTIVLTDGHYSKFDGFTWIYVNFIMNGVRYFGYSSSKYLVKTDDWNSMQRQFQKG